VTPENAVGDRDDRARPTPENAALLEQYAARIARSAKTKRQSAGSRVCPWPPAERIGPGPGPAELDASRRVGVRDRDTQLRYARDHLNRPRWSVLLHESWLDLGGDLAAWRGQRVAANPGIPAHMTKLMRASTGSQSGRSLSADAQNLIR
jgi:hypothetical protein